MRNNVIPNYLNPILVFFIIAIYFAVLMIISYFASRGISDDSFYTGNRKSPWALVTYGMVGATLSGVTFV